MKFNIENIKILGRSNSASRLELPEGFSFDFFDDKILMNNKAHAELFEKKLLNTSQSVQGRALVRIKAGNRTLYRLFFGGSHLGLKVNELVLTSRNIFMLLGDSKITQVKLSGHSNLAPVPFLCFYWKHPHNYVRVSFKIALLSLIISILSFL